VEVLENLIGPFEEPIPLNDTQESGGYIAEEDILSDAEVGDKVSLLIDRHDPKNLRDVRGQGFDGLAVDLNYPAVPAVNSGEDLDQRRLSGAVFSDQGMNAPRGEVEVYTVEHLDPGETFPNVADL